jgi:hypothetical protein
VSSAAVVSVAGAPGVTTLVCAAAAASAEHRPLLVVEAPTSGGTIAARWRLDVRDTVSTTATLAMDVTDSVDLWAAAHHPWLATSRVIPAHPSPVVTRQAQVGRWLTDRLMSVGRRPVLIDAGRVDGSAEQFDLLTAVGSVWVLLDPIVEQVVAARAIAEWLNKTGPVQLLVREATGEPARDSASAVTSALAWPLLAAVPYDRHSARALCGLAPPRRNLARAPLLRAGKALADRLTRVEVRT